MCMKNVLVVLVLTSSGKLNFPTVYTVTYCIQYFETAIFLVQTFVNNNNT